MVGEFPEGITTRFPQSATWVTKFSRLHKIKSTCTEVVDGSNESLDHADEELDTLNGPFTYANYLKKEMWRR